MSPCLKVIQQRESGSTKDTRNLLHRPHVQSLEKDFVFFVETSKPDDEDSCKYKAANSQGVYNISLK